MTADGPVFKRWSKDQDRYLRTAWGAVPLLDMAWILGRTENAIKQRAYKLLGTTLDRDPKPGRIRGRRLNKQTGKRATPTAMEGR